MMLHPLSPPTFGQAPQIQPTEAQAQRYQSLMQGNIDWALDTFTKAQKGELNESTKRYASIPSTMAALHTLSQAFPATPPRQNGPLL